MTDKYQYAYSDGDPVLIGDVEAWTVAFEKWKRMDHTEAMMEERLISKADYEDMFPDLPPLPAEAFP